MQQRVPSGPSLVRFLLSLCSLVVLAICVEAPICSVTAGQPGGGHRKESVSSFGAGILIEFLFFSIMFQFSFLCLRSNTVHTLPSVELLLLALSEAARRSSLLVQSD